MSDARKIHADRTLTLEEVYRSFRLTPAEIRSIERMVTEAGFGPPEPGRARKPRRSPDAKREKRQARTRRK